MSKKIVANKVIYPNSMNREDLSKMSKDQLINMLLGKQTASAKKAGPVKQTASAKKAGPVFNPKSLTHLAAEKMEQSIKRPAKQPSRIPSLTQLAARALVKDRIKYFEKLSDKQAPTIRLHFAKKTKVNTNLLLVEQSLRANVCNFRESVDSREFLNFFIFCSNNLYSTLIFKITLKLVTAFYFFRNQVKFEKL